VVIAIVAVLLAILLPSLAKVREYGKRATCMTNLRQLQIAWQTYADEHDGSIVNGNPVYVRGAPQTSGKPWLTGMSGDADPQTAAQAEAMMRAGALAPYVRDLRVYMCPSRYHNLSRSMEGAEWLSSYYIVPSMNCVPPDRRSSLDQKIRAGSSHNIGSTVLFVSKTSELVDPGPSSRMVFMDLGFGYDGALGTLDPQQESWLGTGEFTPIHHTDGTCVSFADGHEEYWKWTDPATVALGRNWVNGTLFGLNRPLVSGSGLSAKNPDAVRINLAFWGKWPLN
jgi:hypothetical protein